jgi:hypothetical protein
VWRRPLSVRRGRPYRRTLRRKTSPTASGRSQPPSGWWNTRPRSSSRAPAACGDGEIGARPPSQGRARSAGAPAVFGPGRLLDGRRRGHRSCGGARGARHAATRGAPPRAPDKRRRLGVETQARLATTKDLHPLLTRETAPGRFVLARWGRATPRHRGIGPSGASRRPRRCRRVRTVAVGQDHRPDRRSWLLARTGRRVIGQDRSPPCHARVAAFG